MLLVGTDRAWAMGGLVRPVGGGSGKRVNRFEGEGPSCKESKQVALLA